MLRPDEAIEPQSTKTIFANFIRMLDNVACVHHGTVCTFNEAVERVCDMAEEAHNRGGTIYFVGNGGSAAIAMHMAADFSKNIIRARCFSNLSTITAISNDCSYDDVFSQQLSLHAKSEDMLVAISSSGRSANILSAVSTARKLMMGVVTFSGMNPGNPLFAAGDLNFHLSSHIYGLIEVGHHCLCHIVLIRSMERRDIDICGSEVSSSFMVSGTPTRARNLPEPGR